MNITAREAQQAHKGQLKWANMLRPDYCEKGRYFAGVSFPIIYIKDVIGVTKDDILQGMKKLGAEISYPTLNRYVNSGMVTKPLNLNKGRGQGKISQYPVRALYETFAAALLMRGGVKFPANAIQLVFQEFVNNKEAFILPRSGIVSHIDLLFFEWKKNFLAAYFLYDANLISRSGNVDLLILGEYPDIESRNQAIMKLALSLDQEYMIVLEPFREKAVVSFYENSGGDCKTIKTTTWEKILADSERF